MAVDEERPELPTAGSCHRSNVETKGKGVLRVQSTFPSSDIDHLDPDRAADTRLLRDRRIQWPRAVDCSSEETTRINLNEVPRCSTRAAAVRWLVAPFQRGDAPQQV